MPQLPATETKAISVIFQSEQQRCLTQTPPSWSSTTIRTSEPRSGVCLRSLGIDVQLFASISDFLKSDPPDGPTCLVLDVRLPGQSGLDFQRELAAANRELPIIFITGHGDIPMSVQAMKGGAIEFLTKPFRDQDLLDAIQLGFRAIVRGGRMKRLWPTSGSASPR